MEVDFDPLPICTNSRIIQLEITQVRSHFLSLSISPFLFFLSLFQSLSLSLSLTPSQNAVAVLCCFSHPFCEFNLECIYFVSICLSNLNASLQKSNVYFGAKIQKTILGGRCDSSINLDRILPFCVTTIQTTGW